MNKLTEAIENTTYEGAMWLLLGPKTFGRVLRRPGWVSSYIVEELEKPTDAQFDEYMAPFLFFLIFGGVPSAVTLNSMVVAIQKVEPGNPYLAAFVGMSWLIKLTSVVLQAATAPLSVAAVGQWVRKRPLGRKELGPLFLANTYIFGAFYGMANLALVGCAWSNHWGFVGIAITPILAWLLWAQTMALRSQHGFGLLKVAFVLFLANVVAPLLGWLAVLSVLLGLGGLTGWVFPLMLPPGIK